MFIFMPEVIAASGVPVEIVTLEVTEKYMRIRLSSDEVVPAGPRDTLHLAAMRGGLLTLTDSLGSVVPMIQSSSAGGDPFQGIADIAFPLTETMALRSPLTLASKAISVTFVFDPSEINDVGGVPGESLSR